MINTHEKLISTVLEKQVSKEIFFNILKDYGYKGAIDEIVIDLLFAIGATDAYIYNSQKVDDYKEHLTEEEYFEILIKHMNVNY